MVRAMPGHGNLMHKRPSLWFSLISDPDSSMSTGWILAKGRVPPWGLVGVTKGIGEIKIPPVSVCHQVSTIGDFFSPTFSLYQCQASSLMDSPTEPRTFRLLRSYLDTKSTLSLARALMAVGAV